EMGFETLSSTQNNSSLTNVDAPGVHPGTSANPIASQKVHIVPSSYIAEIFHEVFTSSTYPVSNLDTLIDKWVNTKTPQYGGSCDMYSSFSTKDCNGSISNTDLPYFADGNTVRESFQIQMCENILGIDAGVSAALEKIQLTVASPIDQNSLTQAYGLFYRADPPSIDFISTLLDLDKNLSTANESLKERWRAALAQICESPGWQLF
ncbi:MAG TPA: hypothetical protein VN132_13750, partial [Bdellovibrio sp.]|nr:hypothetical protein [Bdellovibrio sp.]